MTTTKDIENTRMQSGYDHVHFSPTHSESKPYEAAAYGGQMDAKKRKWRGPRRATAIESAQDYCDYVNGNGAQPQVPARLISAGHVRVKNIVAPSPKRAAAKRLFAEALSEERRTNGFVYCISDGTALKIGKTANHPLNRVADLQTGNPRLLRLVAFVEADDVAAAEAAMHARFAHLSVLGEWFETHDDILTEFGANIEADATVET